MNSSRFRLLFIAGLFATVVSTGSYVLFFSRANGDEQAVKIASVRPMDQLFGWQYPVALFPELGQSVNKIAYSTIRDPGGMPQGLPIRLKIPAISVDSAIEDALITPDGRMDVPYGSVNVAWFSLGPKPGREGSAVIGGHFGMNAGVKFVFYDLDKLKIGDRIYIIDDNGKTLAFQVRKIELFERDADATTVFTSRDGFAHLNLITCEGIWNRTNDTYPLRRVVFTDAISNEGAADASATFFRALGIGDRGTDVAELQTVLEKKGFLVLPRGVSKGYFGSLTRAALVKYQGSVSLPPTGVLNFSTRNQLMPSDVIVREPAFPATAIAPAPRSLFDVVMEHVKSLYATPIDGLITSLLLASTLLAAVYTLRKRSTMSDECAQ